MYTQCPDCQTRFRVTAGVLRAARGTVRCGRCGSAFDALERLSDAMPPAQRPQDPLPLLLDPIQIQLASLGEPARDEPSAETASVFVDESRAAETITLEGERVSFEIQPDRDEPPEREPDPDATDRYEILRIPESSDTDERDAEREIEALVQRLQREFGPDDSEPDGGFRAAGDTAEMPAEPPAAEPLASALEAKAAVAEAVVVEPEPTPPVEPTPASGPAPMEPAGVVAASTRVEELPLAARRWRTAPVEVVPEPAAASRRSIWATLAWTAGSLLLALLLAAQVVHHWRDQLARDARLGPALRTTYARLGLELPPSWDLAAIELRQWGNDDRDSGRMVVRASLTNRAAFAQPNPILRLQFEDRYGSMIAARDFEPSDYLPSAAQATRLLAPGASSEAELVLADPGPEAVGYRLDVCQRDPAGQLRCAQDPG